VLDHAAHRAATDTGAVRISAIDVTVAVVVDAVAAGLGRAFRPVRDALARRSVGAIVATGVLARARPAGDE
jgi:hypothetical protein